MKELINNSCYERWLSVATYNLHRLIRNDRELMWDYLEWAYHQLEDDDSLINFTAELESKVRNDERINRTMSESAMNRVIWSDIAESFVNQLV